MQNKTTCNYIALIPAYKPAPVLPKLTEKLKILGFSVILVDDGSGAAYEKLFLESSKYSKVLYQSDNLGKGHALKEGLTYVFHTFGSDCVVVTVDADGQHRPEDALSIARLAEQNANTLVLGSRKLKGSVPLRSRFGNTITRTVFHLSTGRKVHDTQTGLRAFRGELIPKLLSIPGERYEYEMNVLLRFAGDQTNMIEHEIETIYLDHNRSSHFHPIHDSFRIYRQIVKFSFSSIVSFLVDYTAYSLILLITGKLWTANVLARIISGYVNFTLNRKFVFKSNDSTCNAALKYFLLAVAILCGNTLVLEFFVNICGVHKMLAKIITEMLFFLLSWNIQRLVIFRKPAGGER